MKTLRLLSIFVLAALVMSTLTVRAKVTPLLEVPDYLPGNVKTDLSNQRADLVKRVTALRQRAADWTANCGQLNLQPNDPCFIEKAKLVKDGEDYSRDALAFDDEVLYDEEVLKATQIGTAAVVRGKVFQQTPDGRDLEVTSGKPIFLNSHITTSPDGRLQVLLLDETIFTLGPNSDMVLDEFVYDPKTSVGKVMASFAKGTFRFVTGKIAPHDPEHMKVKIPVGTIGVRGTDFEVSVEPDGDGYVKLFSGKLEITETKSGAVFDMDAGQMVKFHADGTWEPVTSLDAT